MQRNDWGWTASAASRDALATKNTVLMIIL